MLPRRGRLVVEGDGATLSSISIGQGETKGGAN